jgi:hypothetical protein
MSSTGRRPTRSASAAEIRVASAMKSIEICHQRS